MTSSIQRSHGYCDECHKLCKVKGLIMFKGKRVCGRCKRKIAILMPPYQPTIKVGSRVIDKPVVPVRHITNPVFSTSFSVTDSQALLHQCMSEGMSYEEATAYINSLKKQIKAAHQLYEQKAQENAPSFKEAFDKLIRGDKQ